MLRTGRTIIARCRRQQQVDRTGEMRQGPLLAASRRFLGPVAARGIADLQRSNGILRTLAPHASRFRCMAIVLGGMALLASSGCSESANAVAPFGRITRNGEPVEDGQILFLPSDKSGNPSARGPITRGRYEISKETGLKPGSFVVVVKVGVVHRAPGTLRPTSRIDETRFDRQLSLDSQQMDFELDSTNTTPPAR